ncbi:hypothetical protein AWM79_15225 [Pseudomonas agarici]|uniref:Uncharacterized protein n=1 Tax=Pseudomonas agarici TaxID=46677 RepID=A0A0X1T3H9_PSEAA|nr:hypothetical protein AWM79_15225 [Pseudomonas agarici]
MLEVVPVALEFLREDFLAGFKYDGELIVALGELSSEFWSENRVMADEVFLIVDSFVYSGIDASLAIDILVLKERTRGR